MKPFLISLLPKTKFWTTKALTGGGGGEGGQVLVANLLEFLILPLPRNLAKVKLDEWWL